ncbi:MAG TPA: methyltransferase domain-containing protein, partial [Mucilaginibacter sp.]|nr:methyltransferase domain-containing protein [Mucilaginibacter sp.]
MKNQDLTVSFQNVDKAQTDFLIKFLEDAHQFPTVQEGFEMQLKLLDIKPGNHVLDVGCGIGDQALTMAKQAGTNGKVIGTDLSHTM